MDWMERGLLVLLLLVALGGTVLAFGSLWAKAEMEVRCDDAGGEFIRRGDQFLCVEPVQRIRLPK